MTESLFGNDGGDAQQTLKPVYEFRWYESESAKNRGGDPVRVRRTDDLENDSAAFGEAGVEMLAEKGRCDPVCEVKRVGLTTMA